MAATRLYFAAGGTSTITPAFPALWDSTTGIAQRPLQLASQLTGTTDTLATQVSETSTTNAFDRLCRQHATDSQVGTAHTISGTFSMVIQGVESSASLNGFLQVTIEVWDSTGTTLRGTLYSGTTNTAESASAGAINQEFPITTAETRIISAQAVTSVAASVGDRIVVCLGFRACNTSATSMGVQFRIDDKSADSDHSLAAGTTTTGLRPWIEFSDDIFATGALSTGAAVAETATTTTTGVVGATTGSAVAATATITDTGVVGKTTGAAIAATATVTASGSVGTASGASVSATATVTAAGSVTSGLASGATLSETATTTAAGAVGAVAAATIAAVDTVTAGGRVGKVAGATVAAAASIVAAGRVGLSADATVSATVTIAGNGSEAAVGITVSWWDGTTEQSATLLGWWDGTTVHPATALGWWDGAAVQTLA